MREKGASEKEEELRSEKVRRLLGEMPRSLTKWGIVIIAVILAALAAVVCLMPYPYSGGESIISHMLR